MGVTFVIVEKYWHLRQEHFIKKSISLSHHYLLLKLYMDNIGIPYKYPG
jgi:hypothetical protein